MISKNRFITAIVLCLVAGLMLTACDSGEKPSNAITLRWVYSTAIADWAQESIDDFNNQKIKVDGGRPIWVEGIAADAGQAVSDMVSGSELPVLWTAADTSWVEVLHESAGSEIFLENSVSVVESPLVIAMWEPIARALGWPARTLGWLDIASLAADPSGWAYYSGGEWGNSLRISHAHPGLSDSGVQTLQALVYAAESADSISATDIEDPIVQASVGAFESAVSWFGTDTRSLQDAMFARGLDYLNAGIMYENSVVMQGDRDPGLVAIYPFEGTFVATFPTNVRANMDENTTRAAETFLAYLTDTTAQTRALQFGLRPVNDSVALAAPIDAAHGANPDEPAAVFATAGADTIFAIQDLWQTQRKNVNLVMVLDVSGSMEGRPIDEVRRSAVEFVEQMGDEDRISVIIFYDTQYTLVPNTQILGNRQNITNAIATISAGGGTSLFDAIAFAAADVKKFGRGDEVNAIVVLTDGQDTTSTRFTAATEAFSQTIESSGASITTIGYGDDADHATLESIAMATNGLAHRGDVSTISDVYGQISAAFGGSAGIGR